MTNTYGKIPIFLPNPIPNGVMDLSGNTSIPTGGVTTLIALATVLGRTFWVVRFLQVKIPPVAAGTHATVQVRITLVRQGVTTVLRFDKDVAVMQNLNMPLDIVLAPADTILVEVNNVSGGAVTISAALLIDVHNL